MFTLEIKGPGFAELKKMAADLAAGDEYVVAGFTGEAPEEHEGISNAELAQVHEFGSPARGIPARPFIMPSFTKNKATYQKLLAAAIRKSILVGVARGFEGAEEFRRGLRIIGAKMASDMKNEITQAALPGVGPAPSPATLARKVAKGKWKKGGKGSPRNLVDTGQMVRSITWGLRGGSR